VDDKLVAEGDVGRVKQNHLKATFTVPVIPVPVLWPPLTLVAGLAPLLFVGGVVAYSEAAKVVR
jgi:hypothetical protein